MSPGAHTDTDAAGEPPTRSSLQRLRETINVELLHSAMEALLDSAGRDVVEWHAWPAVLAQVRISSADTKWRTLSSSPEHQVNQLAEYCVRYSFRPVELCFEAQSGSLSAAKPRRVFERYYQRLETGELEVVAVITYHIDRFTRDRFVGEKWLRMLKARGIDLHETDEMNPPRPLADREEEIASKLFGAWRETKRTSKRFRDTRSEQRRAGRLLASVNHFGHRPVYETRNGRRVEARGVLILDEADVLREATLRVHAAEPLMAVVVDFNERGLRGRRGGRWSHSTLRQLLISPRLAGLQRHNDELVPRDIEPVISEKDWKRNCELLAQVPREKSDTATRQASLSSFCRCAVCGAPLKRTPRSSNSYYRCSRPDLAGLRRCHCEEGTDDCSCYIPHGARNIRVLDRFLLEVALAAIEASREQAGITTFADREDEQLKGIRAELSHLDERRRELARSQRQDTLAANQVEPELRLILAKSAHLRGELAQCRTRELARSSLSGSIEDHRVQAVSDPLFARALVEQVIDHCIVAPRDRGYQTPHNGIDVVLAEPYLLPAGHLDALRQRLNAARSRELLLASRWPPRWTREDAERAFELHSQGWTTADVARHFNLGERHPQRGNPLWAPHDVKTVLRRICAERNIPYQHRRNASTEHPYETRRLVSELCSNPARSFGNVAVDLNRMGVQHYPSGRWNDSRVERCYTSECERRRELPLARTPDGG